MSKPNILIVEDDGKISRVLQLELEYEDYTTQVVHDGKSALKSMVDQEWDLILLDIMIPELSGLEVLRRFRKTNDITPVILVTARDEVFDKVSGLDSGANDYITKPFEIEELLARIRVHLRSPRHAHTRQNLLTVGELTADLDRHEVNYDSNEIQLTAREFDLLVCLLKNANIVMTREQLIEQVWGFDYYGETNVVDVYIRYLRQKIDKEYGTSYIQTVRGVGYTIKEPVS